MDSGGGNSGSSDSAKPSPTETATNSLPGCGCASASNITVRVTPTTGGQFDLQVAKTESVENLKKLISKKLKVPKERICLLHRDRQLRDGTLQENQLMDGSRLTLLPSVETGLLAQRPEQSVMQALESLNDSQVNDFLSGKAPLNLTMRLGDHMMLIQLQLSTVTPSSSRRSPPTTQLVTSTSPSLLTTSRNSLASSLSSVIAGAAATTKSAPSSPQSSITTFNSSQHCQLKPSAKTNSFPSSSPPSPSSSTPPPPLIPLNSEVRTSLSKPSSPSTTTTPSSGFKFSTPLSLSGRPYTAFFPKPVVSTGAESSSSSSTTTTTTTTTTTSSASSHTPSSSPSSSSSSTSTSELDSSSLSRTSPVTQSPLKSLEDAANLLTKESTSTSTQTHSCPTAAAGPCKCEPPTKPTLDTRALAEASRNLTQTLKQLSSEVLTSRSDPAEDSARSRRQGAIIESMHHHGKGVYSGTFSGTLNPALQDRFGRPKRDISTIIHILNDLLCATPQYRRHARQGHTITVEASSSTPKQSSSTATTEKTPTNVEFMEESVSLSRENQATRGKMEHLRLIMEERRARRRARREARAAPYTTQWSAKSESVPQPTAMGHDTVEPMETSEQSTGSEQQLCELNPPEPVVA